MEAKSQLHNEDHIKKLYDQMQKYLPKNANTHKQYLNPLNKKPVVVLGDIGNQSLNHPLLKELAEDGVIFIDGINNLKKLY